MKSKDKELRYITFRWSNENWNKTKYEHYNKFSFDRLFIFELCFLETINTTCFKSIILLLYK